MGVEVGMEQAKDAAGLDRVCMFLQVAHSTNSFPVMLHVAT